MKSHTLPGGPTHQNLADTTGWRLAPPGLLHVVRWEQLTDSAVAKTGPIQPHTTEVS